MVRSRMLQVDVDGCAMAFGTRLAQAVCPYETEASAEEASETGKNS